MLDMPSRSSSQEDEPRSATAAPKPPWVRASTIALSSVPLTMFSKIQVAHSGGTADVEFIAPRSMGVTSHTSFTVGSAACGIAMWSLPTGCRRGSDALTPAA